MTDRDTLTAALLQVALQAERDEQGELTERGKAQIAAVLEEESEDAPEGE